MEINKVSTMSKNLLSLRIIIVFAFVAGGGTTRLLPAGDWPQILGPHRNGVAADETIADVWSEDGPSVVWSKDVGSGFAGCAAASGTAILFHRLGGEEIAEAVDANTGTVLWTARHTTDFDSSFSSDKGPRCVPIIHEGNVYIFGAQGVLRCLDGVSGKAKWTRRTHEDFKVPEGYFGAGSTPIVEGDRIIVNVGSRPGAGVVAFSTTDGSTVWFAVDDTASYSSPVATTIDGVRHLLFVGRLKTVSLDPETGDVRFEMPFGRRGATVNGANPVVISNHLFLTSSYGIGSVFVKIGRSRAEPVWSDTNVMASQYCTPVTSGNLLYGIDGRQDAVSGSAVLKCVDPHTRQVRWSEPGFDYATLIRVNERLLILTCGGELILVGMNPDRYHELARAQVLRKTPRGYRLPALSNGRLFVRDDRTLKCLELR